MNSTFRLNPQIMSLSVALALGVGALTAPQPAYAFGGVVIDPTHIINTIITRGQQYQQHIQTYTLQLEQYRDQIMKYQEMMRQGMQFTDAIFDPIQSTITDIVSIYHDSKALARTFSDLDQEFRDRYKGYGGYLGEVLSGTSAYGMSNRHARWNQGVGGKPDAVSADTAITTRRDSGNGSASDEPPTHDTMAGQYHKWANENYENAKLALQAAGIPASLFEDDKAALQKLVERSKNAQGRMQAIQAGNDIAVMLVQQMQRLNILVGDQIRLQANWIANQTNRTYAADEARQKIQNPRPQNTPSKGFRGQ